METGGLLRALRLDVWKLELARRAALLTPAHVVRGVFIRGTLEAIRELGGEELSNRCIEVCGLEQLVDLFSYPLQLEFQVLSAAMSGLAAHCGSFERGLWLVGHRAGLEFGNTTGGKVLVDLATGEPRKLLKSLPSAYRMSVSYGEHSLNWSGPTSAHWTMKGEFMPYPFHEGALTAMMEKTSAQAIKVAGRQTDLLDSAYDLSWE